MAKTDSELLIRLFGQGKGAGAALMMFVLGVAGILVCLLFGRRLSRYHYAD